MNMHLSGVDLTDQLAAAPHFAEGFTKMTVKEVGYLRPDQRSVYLPWFMKTLINYFPMLRRHPHPISIHFPIVYLSTALLFLVLHMIPGQTLEINFEVFAFVMLLLGVLSSVAAVGTGFLTLWINYRFKKPKLVVWKIRSAIILLIAGILAVIIRATGMVEIGFVGWIYNLLILALALLVMGLGYLGGPMVFPTKAR